MKNSTFGRCATILSWAGLLTLWLVLSPSGFAQNAEQAADTDSGWSHYGNDGGGMRYSPLTQVNRENVTQLKIAWTYRTGALEQLGDLKHNATFEATPILVEAAYT